MSSTIHWLGVGLSSTPGIKYLSESDHSLVVWNRRLDKAHAMLNDCSIECELRQLDWAALSDAINEGDIVVSMLPTTMHLQVAQLCLDKSAHFTSSSYISPEMASLDQQAKDNNLCFVNEVGLDPGIDHLFAHLLVDDYKHSSAYAESNQLYFRSYCGGFPKVANDFKYKFSWSPLGVLKALTSAAKWLEQGSERNSQGPWTALKDIQIEPANEVFQAYPNRDSLPFIVQYAFAPEWNIQEFVRGTLRLDGWAQAWQYLFDEVATLEGEEGMQRLSAISRELENQYSYDEGEADRVVLSVELEAKQGDKTVWHQTYFMDAHGNQDGAAMARLVSLPVSLAIESIINGEIDSGVSAAPSDPELIQKWLSKLAQFGEAVIHKRYC